MSWAASAPGAAAQPLDAEQFVATVLRAHPYTAQREALVRGARAERRASRLFDDPVIEVGRDRARPLEGTGGSAWENSLQVTQALPWPGTYAARRRFGDRAAAVLEATSASLQWEVEQEARLAFARLVTARTLVEVATEAESDARLIRDLVTRRAEVGETREADRLRVQVEWLRQQRVRDEAQRRAVAAEAVLRALAGDVLPVPLEVRDGTLPAADLTAEAADWADRSPSLRIARLEAERRQAALDLARQARFPDLDVSYERARELDKTANGFAVGLRLPLWNANRGEIARAEAEAALGRAEAERLRLQLSTEVETRRAEVENARRAVLVLEEQILPAAGAAVHLARLSYENGETSLLDLIDAQRTQRETQQEAAEARLALFDALTELRRLVGAPHGR